MGKSLIINTDGGARGNPGPAGIGIVVVEENAVTTTPLFTHAEYIGAATNNEAEYKAFLTSLQWLLEYIKNEPTDVVSWKLDSMLVVEQLLKHWKIKEPRMRQFAEEIWHGLDQLKRLGCAITISHVRREHNAQADALVNQALDEYLTSH